MYLALSLLLACGPPPGDTGEPCVAAPAQTWDNFGQGFMIEACQGCHASTATQRYGAPQDVTFDSAAQVWAHAGRVLARAAPTDGPPTMPPAGGTTEEDRARLRWWLTCGEPGT